MNTCVSIKMRKGVLYFLIYINDIINNILCHVSNTLHADDLAIWSAAAYRFQERVKKIQQWVKDLGLEINRLKTIFIIFSLSTAKEKVQIKLGDTAVPQADRTTFFCVKLDS